MVVENDEKKMFEKISGSFTTVSAPRVQGIAASAELRRFQISSLPSARLHGMALNISNDTECQTCWSQFFQKNPATCRLHEVYNLLLVFFNLKSISVKRVAEKGGNVFWSRQEISLLYCTALQDTEF